MREAREIATRRPFAVRLQGSTEERLHRLEEVAAAAQVFRSIMECYRTEQAALVEQGVSLDDLVRTNWIQFEQVVAAEERLFAAIDGLAGL